MEAPSRPIRVLVRPPPAPSLLVPPQIPPTPPTEVSSSSKTGIVVVGFIGKRHHDVAHFINKIIDSHVFGSGKLDNPFRFDPEKLNPEMKRWFQGRNLSFYYDDVQGFVYLQFSSLYCPVVQNGLFEKTVGFEPIFDEQELADLQGLLFMFSVCHIIVFIQEGCRFNMITLRRFRVLQAAKNKLASFIRSRNVAPVTSRPGYSKASASGSSPGKHSPVKGRVILNRNNSAAIISGLSSHTTLLPGQCSPVLLFVFLDDFTEIQPSRNTGDILSSSKGSSGSSVMLSRPVANSVGGLKKKLQSSLEAQIRFSIKKCRIISSSEASHAGVRGSAVTSSAPIFTLDAAKAVSLVDSFSIQSGESLEFAIGLIEQVLEGKETPDSILSGNHLQNSNKDDIVSVKEFISKQSGLLRGRGGLAGNSSSNSAPGAGMFAAAAAAAAASASASPFAVASTHASSGKMMNAPELPSFDIWSSSCLVILQEILSAKCDFTSAIEFSNMDEESLVLPSYESAVSHLKNSIGINTRFSAFWCQKFFPVAMEVYLDNLPSCYTSSQHEEHLKKALLVLRSKAKGPALSIYLEKLKDECTSIWTSGRQLCDGVSLTGKPCVHQRHDGLVKPHSSGYVYLHACACGRSRRVRPDPFDFESANVADNDFAGCDKILPNVKLPVLGSVHPLSWSLIRIGSAEYYQPLKGLCQSGFCSTQKFLQRWTVNHPGAVDRNTKGETVDGEFDVVSGSCAEENDFCLKFRISSSAFSPHGGKYNDVGKGVPNFTMRKPFAEVVAGCAQPSVVVQEQDKVQEAIPSGESQTVDNKQEEENGISGIATSPYVNRDQAKAQSSMEQATVYVGFEHECPQGHRFILNSDHLKELGSPYWFSEENVIISSTGSPEEKEDPNKKGKNQGQGRSYYHLGNRSKNLSKSKQKVINGGTSSKKSVLSTGQGKNNQDQRGKFTDSETVNGYDGDGDQFLPIVNRNLPLYMNCPHCRNSFSSRNASNHKFAGTVSQLQRIFMVTPSYPVVLALNPVIQFELSCLPASITYRETKLRFSFGSSPVILPPDSFLSLRLPFIYVVEMEDGSLYSLKPFQDQPQYTAYVVKDTSLQIVSDRSKPQ